MSIRTLVIDDSYASREGAYRNLAAGPAAEAVDLRVMQYPFKADEIARACRQSQVALVDIFLDPQRNLGPLEIATDTNVLDVLEAANPRLPVFLVSDRWDQLNLPLYRRLLQRKRIVGGVTLAMLSDLSECARVRLDIQRAVGEAWGIASTGLGPDDDLLVLHISDLQFGDEWASGEDNQEVAGDRIVNEVFQALPTGNDGRAISPHILAVTGDIAQRGEPREFQIGLVFLQRLRARLKIRQECCFVVPGNHDVSLPLASSHLVEYAFGKPFGFSKRMSNPKLTEGLETRGLNRFGLAPFQEFCRAFTHRSDWTYELGTGTEPGTSTWFQSSFYAQFGLSILCINTVSFLGPEDPSRVEIPERTVISVTERLDACREQEMNTDQVVHLVLLHHSPWRDIGDRTLKEDGDFLLTQLSKHGDCVFLFGHIHEALANVRTYTAHANRQALYVTSSTASLAAQARPEDSLRGFNLLRFQRQADVITGARVQRFEYKGLEYKIAGEADFKRDPEVGWVRSKL